MSSTAVPSATADSSVFLFGGCNFGGGATASNSLGGMFTSGASMKLPCVSPTSTSRQVEHQHNSHSPSPVLSGASINSPVVSPNTLFVLDPPEASCSGIMSSKTKNTGAIKKRVTKKRATGRQYKCATCEKVLPTRTTLKKHLDTVHPQKCEDINIVRQCLSCDFRTTEREVFDAHAREHLENGLTPLGKKRQSNQPLQRHRLALLI